MYNRYIPEDTQYTWVEAEPAQKEPKRPSQNPPPQQGQNTQQDRRPQQGQSAQQGWGPQQGQNAQQGHNPQQGQRPPKRPAGGQGNSTGANGFSFASLLSGKDVLGGLFSGKDGLGALFSGKEKGGLSNLLSALKLDSIDAGDVLLLLIILFLLVEGDDLDLVIALGVVLLMGLGDREKKDEAEE